MSPARKSKAGRNVTGAQIKYRFSRRMAHTPRSFIREILKVTEHEDIISFAGGLPSPDLIDTAGLAQAASEVLATDGKTALQYATTEGDPFLRTFIAERYRRRLGLQVSSSNILITNGSQQCLDLIGKILIDPGDDIAIERPGYLGAIQAFSQYEPRFHPVPIDEDGPDPAALRRVLDTGQVRLMYGVPNSQNPSGITWSSQRRREVAGILAGSDTLFIEDDAYGELNFDGDVLPSVSTYLPDQTVMTGSFSKILAPGMRLGWICAPDPVMERLVTVKQATDLHSNFLSQKIAARYLAANDIDAHIRKIREVYRDQCRCMLDRIREDFPEGTQYTRPRGGMFTWVTLPAGCSAMQVFESALRKKVAVLPGIPFYVDGGGTDTLRLNFSNSDPAKIRTGIHRLGAVIAALCRP